MENRKEIEKAKQRLKDRIEVIKKLLQEASTFGELTVDIIKDNKAINTLLKYIKELEQENKKLNKKLKK